MEQVFKELFGSQLQSEQIAGIISNMDKFDNGEIEKDECIKYMKEFRVFSQFGDDMMED